MKKCTLCKTHLSAEWFPVKTSNQRKTILCFSCREAHFDILFESMHCVLPACCEIGCQERTDDIDNDRCAKHMSVVESSHIACLRCRNVIDESFSMYCFGCNVFLRSQEILDYRAFGSTDEIEKIIQELSDYKSLGSYEQLVDVVSRNTINEHLAEFKDGIIKHP